MYNYIASYKIGTIYVHMYVNVIQLNREMHI